MFLYESHLCGYYTAYDELEDTYCDTCGDSDYLIGEFETEDEKEELIRLWEGENF